MRGLEMARNSLSPAPGTTTPMWSCSAASAENIPPEMPISSRPLPRSFFNRDPRLVSRDLLGTVLVRREGKQRITGRVVEVEAYLGENDPAAHAAAGRTPRNAVLFGPPGIAYIYFI